MEKIFTLYHIRPCGYNHLHENYRSEFQIIVRSDKNQNCLAFAGKGELCVCDLMEVLALPQSTVSRHLAYLRNAGLVRDQRKGGLDVLSFARKINCPVGRYSKSSTICRPKLSPQAAEDRKLLEKYLKTKRQDACESKR